MDVDDGRGTQIPEMVLVGYGPGRQQRPGRVVGNGHDHGIGREGLLGGRDGEAGRGAVARYGLDALGRHPEADFYAGPLEGGAGPLPMQSPQRHPAPTDVGGSGVRQQAGLEHLRRHGQRRLAGREVDGRHGDEIPKGGDTLGRLTVPGQPRPERLLVQGRIRQVQAAQRHQRPPRGQSGAHRHVREAEKRGGQVQGRGQGTATEPAHPDPAPRVGGRRHHGKVETVRQLHVGAGADAAEEGQVLVAATQENVLTVVDPTAAVLERPGQPAQAVAPLQERHPGAAVGAFQRRGQSGQPTADHHDAGAIAGGRRRDHAVPRARARSATAAFSRRGNDMRPCNTPLGSRWIRTRRRW